MNLLAIDFGLTNVGIAVGDTTSGIAFPHKVLKNDRSLFTEVKKMCKKRDIDLILVGKPERADQSPGTIDEQIEGFVDELLLIGPEVATVSERYTSKMAKEKLKDLELKKTDRQKPIDDMAAQIFLQEWLDQR